MAKTEIIYTATLDASGIVTGVNQANQSFELFESSAKKLKDPLKGAQKGFEDFNSAAGVAGSTVTEFGRLISDAPYGIQGMANNLSQLGSMFSLLVVKAQKMNNELSTFQNIKKLLTAQIFGPVGILVAFQAIVAAIEIFTSKQKKADDAVNDFNQSMFAQGEILLSLREKFRQGNLTFEQREQIIKKLALADSKLNDVINSTTLSQAQKNKIYEDYIDIQEKIAQRETALMEAQALLEEKKDATIVSEQEYIALITERDELEAKLEQTASQRKKTQIRDSIKQLEPAIELYEANQLIYSSEAVLYDLRKQQSDLFKKDKPQEEKARKGSLDWYKEQISKLTDLRDKTATTKKAFFELTSQIEDLKNEMENLFGKDVQNDFTSITASAYEATEMFADQLKQLGITEFEFDEYRAKKKEESDKRRQEEIDAAFEEQKLALERRIELTNQIADGLSVLSDFFNASAERDIAIEKNKTTKINNELRERLKNENLSAAQKERINKRIAKNEYNLDKSLDKIREKQFKQQKAFKIAVALADTASAAMKAYLSQLSVPDPATAIPRAKAAAAVATAFGLLQVATIAKQKYVAGQTSISGLGGGTSTGGGGEISTPDFNVVGASQLNQVAAAVTGQQERPIRTYVVASDVSTAQELDRNILSEASIG